MRTYMVAGTGMSGISAVRLLLWANQNVLLYDGNTKLDKDSLISKVSDDGKYNTEKLSVYLGELTPEVIKKYAVDICVISPGISLEVPFALTLKKENIPIIGEVELAYCYSKGDVIAITGTNGKTTTTALTGLLMENYAKTYLEGGAYDKAFTVGNIGIPYAERAHETTDTSVIVCEISSFMLETITSFRANVAAILNITPDHLDRHKTMDCYIKMKERVTEYQTEDDTIVLNYEDEVLREFGKTLTQRVIYFSSKTELREGIFLRGDEIIWKENGVETVIIKTDELNIIGRHNHENAMASIAIGMALNVPLEIIRKTMREFTAVEHRIEYVKTVNGVKYYNDSKGTNPDAAIQAVRAMSTPTILIGGGYDKHSEYDEWINAFDGKVKCLLLMGQTREKIAKTCDELGFKDYRFVENMEEAVKVASELAKPGETVLLSPACASWGMFENFEQRGRIFKELVRNL